MTIFAWLSGLGVGDDDKAAWRLSRYLGISKVHVKVS
jgi:hypothetical protein